MHLFGPVRIGARPMACRVANRSPIGNTSGALAAGGSICQVATRIIDISLDTPVESLFGLDHYDRALFLVRQNGVPIGQVSLPIHNGRIDRNEIRDALREQLAAAAAQRSAAELLPTDEKNQNKRLSATVAVCTRERPEDLSRCLASLQKLIDSGQELLVVDNCPLTQATKQVVDAHPAVRYVCEPRRGLNNARNRALREATGEIVAFVDDDAMVDPRWLVHLLKPFADGRVQCVTGLTMPLELETESQEIFEKLAGFSRRGFVRRVFECPPMSPLSTGPIGAGANMAIRRSVCDMIGTFDPALDAGTATRSGGDHEFFTRLLRNGHRIVYEPAALNWHRHRRTWRELKDVMYGYGVGVYAMWTRTLIHDRDWGVFRHAFGWFVHDQAPNLVRSLLYPARDLPFDVLLAELRGCWAGPFAYMRARREARRMTNG